MPMVLAAFALLVWLPSAAHSQTIVEAMYESTVASIDAEGRPTDVKTGDPIMIFVRYDADAMPTSEDDPMVGVFADALLALEITLPATGDFFSSDETSLFPLFSQLNDVGVPGFLLTDTIILTADLVSTAEISGIFPSTGGISLSELFSGPGAPDLIVDAQTLTTSPPDVEPFGAVDFSIDLRTSTQAVTIVGDSITAIPVPEPSSLAAVLTSLSCVLSIASFRGRRSRFA